MIFISLFYKMGNIVFRCLMSYSILRCCSHALESSWALTFNILVLGSLIHWLCTVTNNCLLLQYTLIAYSIFYDINDISYIACHNLMCGKFFSAIKCEKVLFIRWQYKPQFGQLQPFTSVKIRMSSSFTPVRSFSDMLVVFNFQWMSILEHICFFAFILMLNW